LCRGAGWIVGCGAIGMSAMAGLVRLDGLVDVAQLKVLLAQMHRRGPDGQNYWCEENVGLCHAMLHTTPESLSEIIPAQSLDKTVVIVADARLDNRRELFEKLEVPRDECHAVSDSELLLRAYQHWGEACLQHLLGDFVFAIWDKSRQSFFIATDPMGARRLHYFYSEGKFAFATDIKVLLAIQGIQKSLNEEVFLLHASALARLAADKTCFDGIHKLTGGKYLWVNADPSSVEGIRISIHDYYQMRSSELSFGRPEECLEAFRELFRQAVSCRMRTAFPVATLLSGGLDSSSITCVAARQARNSGQSLYAISSCLADGEPGQDEWEFIDLIARHENIPVTKVSPTVGPVDFLDAIHDLTERPLTANPHLYSALYTAASATGARVLLDGIGGERGPTNHGQGYLAHLLQERQLMKFFVEISAQAQVYSRSRYSILKTDILLPLAPQTLLAAYRAIVRRQGDSLRPALTEEMTKKYNTPGFKAVLSKRELYFNAMDKTRLKVIDGGRKDKDAFAGYFNIGCAYPFLDRRVLEFCLGLSPDWFVKNGWKRYFIRAAMEGTLPPKVQWRTDKKPFSPSYYNLMHAGSKKYQAILNEIPANAWVRNYVDVERIKRTVKFLDQRGSWTPVNGADHARIVVDYGVQAIFFLRWFQSL